MYTLCSAACCKPLPRLLFWFKLCAARLQQWQLLTNKRKAPCHPLPPASALAGFFQRERAGAHSCMEMWMDLVHWGHGKLVEFFCIFCIFALKWFCFETEIIFFFKQKVVFCFIFCVCGVLLCFFPLCAEIVALALRAELWTVHNGSAAVFWY